MNHEPMNHIVPHDSSPRAIRSGDKATRDQGKVHLGDNTLVFAPHPVRSGDKVERDTATQNPEKVHLGDLAPIFVR
jgi:hypothetical protein